MQTVLDRVKLLSKRNYLMYGSVFFFYLPLLRFVLSLFHWAVVPIPFEFLKSDYSVLVSFVLMRFLVYVVLRCRYCSRSSYRVIRSVRSVAQIISYEVVFMFFVLTFLFFYRRYSWNVIYLYGILNYGFLKIGFLFTWLVISSAELNRTPFDLVERESELVSRYNVEYSGYNFTFLFLSEYINIWFMGVVFGLIFINVFFFFFCLIFVFLNVFIRGLLPRFKFVDLVVLMWKCFLPFVFIYILFYMFLSM